MQVNYEGETWNVLGLGFLREDGLQYAHLGHPTEGANHKNGFYPKQIAVYIDPDAVFDKDAK